MKTRLIIILALVANSLAAGAQTKYYQMETSYKVGNTTLRTLIENTNNVTLFGSDTRFVNARQTGRDGGYMPEAFVLRQAPAFDSKPEMFALAKRIISESLSATSKSRIANRRFFVEVIINPDTGQVWEVHVHIDRSSPYSFVPPAEFHDIMIRMKRELNVKVTDVGRQLNFVRTIILWEQE